MKTTKKAITLSLGLVMMGAASFAQNLNDAKKAIDAEQYQKATGMLKTLVASQAKEGDNYYSLGNVYLLSDEIDSARVAFTNGITADPKNALNYVGLGRADLQSNNATSAKTNFDKALSLGAKNYQTYLAIGRAYIAQAKPDYAAALPNLQKADELDSKDKDPETFLALADFYAMQKKNTEAYPLYLRALDITPNSTRALVQIGRMFKQAFSFQDAENKIQEAIAIDANYGPAYRELAENEMQWSRADVKTAEAKRNEALVNMRKYLDLTDKSFESRLRYAQFLVFAGDYTTLGQEVATLTPPDPNNPKAFVVIRMRGYSAVENKNYAQGVKYMDELFARKQDESRILGSDYLYLGLAQKNIGNDSLALMNITKAVKLDSTRADTLANFAKSYYASQNFPKAAKVFKQAIDANSKNPNNLTYLYQLGTSDYFSYGAQIKANVATPDRGLLVEADTAFARINRLAPDYEGAYLFRARVNNQLDNLDNKTTLKGLAVPFYDKYAELITKDPAKATANSAKLIEAYNNNGALTALSDVAKAKEYFNKTLAIDPNNANAKQNLELLNKKPAGK